MHQARNIIDAAQRGIVPSEPTVSRWLEGLTSSDIPSAVESIAQFHSLRPSLGLPRVEISGTQLGELALEFHSAAGTLTPGVQETIDRLPSSAMRLHLAHQINLFPSMAIVAQFIFLDCLSRAIEQDLGSPTCQVYVFLDYDFANDSRFRVAHIPDARRRGGSLCLTGAVARADGLKPMWAVPKPSRETVTGWLRDLRTLTLSDVRELGKVGLKERLSGQIESNLRSFEAVVWAAYARSASLADFNAICLSQVINKWWGLPAVFLPGHRLQPLMRNAYEMLIGLGGELSHLEQEGRSCLSDLGIGKSEVPSEQILPFWSICKYCGTRVSVRMVGSTLTAAEYACPVCNNIGEISLFDGNGLDLSPIMDTVSPRIVLDNLLDLVALGVAGGCGYIGQAEHMLLTNYVSHQLGWSLPPHCLWQAKGMYFGGAECRAALALLATPQIRAPFAQEALEWSFTGRGSFVYNLVSCGPQTLLDMWRQHLEQGGKVFEPAELCATRPFDCPLEIAKTLHTLVGHKQPTER